MGRNDSSTITNAAAVPERIVEVIRHIEVPVEVERVVEKIVEKPVFHEVRIEVPVEVERIVEVVHIVEKEVPVEVEKIVYIDRIVTKEVVVDRVDFRAITEKNLEIKDMTQKYKLWRALFVLGLAAGFILGLGV